MSINKLPTIKSYWECGQFIGNKSIKMLWLNRSLNTVYEIFIFRTTQNMTKVTKVTNSDPLSTILTRVLVILFEMMILKALTSIWWNLNVNQAWNSMSKTSQLNGVSSFGVVVLVEQDTSINFTCTLVK